MVYRGGTHFGGGYAYYYDIMKDDGTLLQYVIIQCYGTALPTDFGDAEIKAVPSKGNWNPNPLLFSIPLQPSGKFAGLSTVDIVGGGNPVGQVVSFDITAKYAGIESETLQRIVRRP